LQLQNLDKNSNKQNIFKKGCTNLLNVMNEKWVPVCEAGVSWNRVKATLRELPGTLMSWSSCYHTYQSDSKNQSFKKRYDSILLRTFFAVFEYLPV